MFSSDAASTRYLFFSVNVFSSWKLPYLSLHCGSDTCVSSLWGDPLKTTQESRLTLFSNLIIVISWVCQAEASAAVTEAGHKVAFNFLCQSQTGVSHAVKGTCLRCTVLSYTPRRNQAPHRAQMFLYRSYIISVLPSPAPFVQSHSGEGRAGWTDLDGRYLSSYICRLDEGLGIFLNRKCVYSFVLQIFTDRTFT